MATRDFPTFSFDNWATELRSEITLGKSQEQLIAEDILEDDETVETKVKVKNLWSAFVSGAGLFSDGYVNAGISTVLSCLKQIYGDEFTKSNAINNIGSIGFVGTVVGQLSFGYISDNFNRKTGMLAANIMLIFFTLMCSVGSWGVTTQGFFACFTVWRFFLGVAIGAEYPTSSVIASEFATQLPPGHRNRYFAWFTNGCIDFGFVVAAFVPLVLLWIFTPRHLRAVWRL
ncbi:Glycerophosphoinositol permease, putative, partial [Candida maltosa Xu316]